MTIKSTANILASKTHLSEEDWLALRRKGIGGSECAAAAGMNPWLSPYELWLEKTERQERDRDAESIERMAIGADIEPFITGQFQKKYPDIQVFTRDAVLQHPEEQWAMCNVDAFINDPATDEEGILECKNVGEFSGAKPHWQDGNIPFYYHCQMQWMFFVTGLRWGHLAWLHGGNKFLSVQIKRDDALLEVLVPKCKKFWFDHVLKDVPPPLDGSDSCSEAIKQQYSEVVDKKRANFTESHREIFESLAAAKSAKAHAEADTRKITETIKYCENRIKAFMEDATEGYLGDKLVATWRQETRNKFNASRFKKSNPKLHADYCDETEMRIFRPKLKGFENE